MSNQTAPGALDRFVVGKGVMQLFELDIDGQVHQATWNAGDYDRLTVRSAYGSTYAYRDGRDPESLAKSLLRQLILRAERQAG